MGVLGNVRNRRSITKTRFAAGIFRARANHVARVVARRCFEDAFLAAFTIWRTISPRSIRTSSRISPMVRGSEVHDFKTLARRISGPTHTIDERRRITDPIHQWFVAILVDTRVFKLGIHKSENGKTPDSFDPYSHAWNSIWNGLPI